MSKKTKAKSRIKKLKKIVKALPVKVVRKPGKPITYQVSAKPVIPKKKTPEDEPYVVYAGMRPTEQWPDTRWEDLSDAVARATELREQGFGGRIEEEFFEDSPKVPESVVVKKQWPSVAEMSDLASRTTPAQEVV